ncbi:MAG: hypothetical protein M3357_03300 [Actinomycetota bacterium]|nr:hypothetical protein [Actinomycetota bacterium]
MLDLFPGAQLAVLPGTTHTQVMRRTDAVLAFVEPFLDGRPRTAASARTRPVSAPTAGPPASDGRL